MLPYNTFPSFQELKDELVKEDMTMKIIKEQEEQLKQAAQVMKQMAEEYNRTQEKMATMDTVVRENLRLKEEMAKVYSKSIEQVKGANQSVNDMREEMVKLINIINERTKNNE